MFNVGDIISYVSGGKKIKGTIIEVVPAGVRPDFSNKTGTFRNVYGKTLPKLYDSYIVVDRE